MQIRVARPADVASIEAVVQDAYRPYVALIGGRPLPMDDDYEARVAEGSAFVADEDGVLAVIVLSEQPDHLLIENVAVDPPRQGEGIGGALLAFAEERARAAGLDLLRLYTNAAMAENLAIYTHLGYREESRRTDNGFERVFLAKRVPPSPESA